MFSKDDFTKENAQRLSVIIMTRLSKPPLTSFFSLSHQEKQKFNRFMNEYIQSYLQTEDWMERLVDDFNQIVNEDIVVYLIKCYETRDKIDR